MAVVTATPVEAVGMTPQLEENERRGARLHAAMLDVINAANLAVGEIGFSLQPDDPRLGALATIQVGLDDLWRESGGPEHEREGASEVRRQLDAALDYIGHRGKPAFRARIADAFERVTA